MSEIEINRLKRALSRGYTVMWLSVNNEAHTVKGIGFHPDEPSECAFFERGKYAALYNCELKDFGIWGPITL